MGDVKNLTSSPAVDKIKELANDAGVCMFVTNLFSAPLSARPMATADVDDNGNIWFFSKIDSDKNIDIEKDERVQLFYSNTGSAEYLSVYGNAEILTDRAKIKQLWKPIDKAWFTDGMDDKSITLIKVNTTDAYYWDTKSNKLVSLIKIAVGAVTGKVTEVGVKGKIEV